MGIVVGLLMLLMRLMLVRRGLMPPCMQRMRSSMMAATGRVLKQSMKYFHILVEYFRLPELVYEYTSRKIRRFCLFLQTNGCLSAGRSSKGILFCSTAAALWSKMTASLCPHSPPKTNSLCGVAVRRSRISAVGL